MSPAAEGSWAFHFAGSVRPSVCGRRNAQTQVEALDVRIGGELHSLGVMRDAAILPSIGASPIEGSSRRGRATARR